jgi:hypothetical protein
MQNDNEKIEKEKKNFLANEIAILAMWGGFGRANIYKKDSKEREKIKFREFIRGRLKEYGEQYLERRVSEDEHFLNIENLANEVTAKCGQLLKDDRFRIGIAQKILNLYLKYLWIVWRAKIFHCPFDSRIIAKLGGH